MNKLAVFVYSGLHETCPVHARFAKNRHAHTNTTGRSSFLCLGGVQSGRIAGSFSLDI